MFFGCKGDLMIKILLLLSITITSFRCYSEELTVVTEILFPYQFIEDSGKLGGHSVDIIRSLFELTGDELDIQVLPWSRAYRKAQFSPNTLIFSISRTKLREDLFIWGNCLVKEDIYVWRLKQRKDIVIQTIDDMRPYRMPLIRSSSPEQYFKSLGFKNIYTLNSQNQNISMLFLDRVDIILGTIDDVTIRAKQLNLSSEKLERVMPVKELNIELYFAFSLGTSANIVAKYQQAYKKLVSQNHLVKNNQCSD